MPRTKKNERDLLVLTRLVQAGDIALKVKKRTLAQLGISALESDVLFVLRSTGKPLGVGDIARSILLDSHATQRLLRRMESKDLVCRSKSARHGRAVIFQLAEKGRIIYDKSLSLEDMENPIASLSENEKRVLEELLRKLLRSALSELGIARCYQMSELVEQRKS